MVKRVFNGVKIQMTKQKLGKEGEIIELQEMHPKLHMYGK